MTSRKKKAPSPGVAREVRIAAGNVAAAQAGDTGWKALAGRKHSHYFKQCPFSEVDIYRVLNLFEVTDAALGHAIKKLLVAGGRGGGKDVGRDVQEAIDTLLRWQEMREEEALNAPVDPA